MKPEFEIEVIKKRDIPLGRRGIDCSSIIDSYHRIGEGSVLKVTVAKPHYVHAIKREFKRRIMNISSYSITTRHQKDAKVIDVYITRNK